MLEQRLENDGPNQNFSNKERKIGPLNRRDPDTGEIIFNGTELADDTRNGDSNLSNWRTITLPLGTEDTERSDKLILLDKSD